MEDLLRHFYQGGSGFNNSCLSITDLLVSPFIPELKIFAEENIPI